MKQNDIYTEKFRQYNPIKEEEKIGTKESEERAEKAREKLVINDIKPFLENYKQHIENKTLELKTYLEQQNKSDNDIISLI